MGIVDKIVAGNVTWQEIWEHNIAVSKALAEHERNNNHSSDGCFINHCAHGHPAKVREQDAHTAQLERELSVIKSGVLPVR